MRLRRFPRLGKGISAWPLQAQIIFLAVSVVIFSLSVLALFSMKTIAGTIEDWNAEEVMDLARIVADHPEIKAGLKAKNPASVIQPVARRMRELTGVQFIVILDMGGYRLSHPNPELIGLHFTGGDEQPALEGESYTSRAVGISGPSLRAFVPIKDDSGRQIGVAVVGMWRTSIAESVDKVRIPLYLAAIVSLGVGVVGAVVLAKNVKRTILGLEPKEIATLLNEREAILQSVREGVIAIDKQKKITLINEAAKRMLGVTTDVVGLPVNDTVPNTRLPQVVDRGEAEYDQEQAFRGTLVLTNRIPIRVQNEVVGAVATFRDMTEVKRLAEELTGVTTFVEGLRAQTHEFMNRLHTISGLIQLGHYQQATAFISDMVKTHQNLVTFVTRRIKDPATAGLLLAKISEAEERGVTVEIDPKTHLSRLPGHFDDSALTMVLGNLIGNAVEEVQDLEPGRRRVRVSIRDSGTRIQLAVFDEGRGIPRRILKRIFERGFSTKPGNSGIGLAMVKQRTELVGGRIGIRSREGQGTCFVVSIPKALGAAEAAATGAAGAAGAGAARAGAAGATKRGANAG